MDKGVNVLPINTEGAAKLLYPNVRTKRDLFIKNVIVPQKVGCELITHSVHT